MVNEWHNRREDTVYVKDGETSLVYISMKDSSAYGLLGDDGFEKYSGVEDRED